MARLWQCHRKLLQRKTKQKRIDKQVIHKKGKEMYLTINTQTDKRQESHQAPLVNIVAIAVTIALGAVTGTATGVTA